MCAGRYGSDLKERLQDVLVLLATDRPMPDRYHDHALMGIWKDCRDCHMKPDLILIYRKPNPDTLELVRLGSHSDLGL